MFGSLLIMVAITMANIKKGILLHKLIALEVRLDTTLHTERPGHSR
jgi:hypothetical protein